MSYEMSDMNKYNNRMLVYNYLIISEQYVSDNRMKKFNRTICVD